MTIILHTPHRGVQANRNWFFFEVFNCRPEAGVSNFFARKKGAESAMDYSRL